MQPTPVPFTGAGVVVSTPVLCCRLMHFDAHQPIIDDLEARIVTIRDSL
jgi:hypothetical protein